MRFNPLVQLTLVKVRDFLREPEAVFWIFVFPVLLIVALGIAFRSGGEERIRVGIEQGAGAARIERVLADRPGIEAEVLGAEAARQRLRTGKVALVVIPGEAWTYWYDPTRPESRLARLAVDDLLQRAAGRSDPVEVGTREMTERGSRYIDFLIPGLLGMNLMGTGMWGIGFYIVNARTKRLLKRLAATPMRRSHFLAGQLAGRLLFLVFEVVVILGFAAVVFDVPVRGSFGALAFVCLLGALTFGGLGLLVAARPRTIEGVSGLMNATMVPMWIASGVFFSTARFPDALRPLVQLLPLTSLNDALRAVMLDGAGLSSVGLELVNLGVWAALSFALALRVFRWS